jgi:anti-sigma regulatory factor (Ser/Thr protein kinase)
MAEEQDISSAEAMLTLDSDLAELERLQKCVDAFCDRATLSEQVRYHLSLVLEELLVNAVKHGRCTPRGNAIEIRLRMSGDRVQIAFSDSGIPFNPLATPPPNVAERVECRPIGGLGIHLVRSLMPEIRYERRGGRNYLFLTKPIEPKTESEQQRGVDADRNGDCAG